MVGVSGDAETMSASPVSWSRVTERAGDRGRTVYWNGLAPDGWRLTVARVGSPGSPWRFSAFEPVQGSTAGRRVYTSDPVGSVLAGRRAAERWITKRDEAARRWAAARTERQARP